MARKHQLRNQRTGTVINWTSKKQESRVGKALASRLLQGPSIWWIACRELVACLASLSCKPYMEGKQIRLRLEITDD
jgi:hypothetical protein